MQHSASNRKGTDIRSLGTPGPAVESSDMSFRQAALIRLIQSLDDGGTHTLEIQARGNEPWNVAVTREDMDMRVAGGRALSREEQWRLEEDPLDIWDKMLLYAQCDALPDAADSYRMKYYGLFSMGDGHKGFMLRIRVPGNQLSAAQMRGLAQMARDLGGGTADITSRGNFQVRDIAPKHTLQALMILNDLGLTSRGSGADNVRNITATPISGIDPQEIADVRGYAKSLHHYILNNRELYGLPRKFNVAFDNGGPMSVSAETNDIGVVPVRVTDTAGVKPGVYFRFLLAGLPGAGRLARDAGILVAENELLQTVIAMIRVFDEHGDRTDRRRARLRHLVDDWGLARFLDVTEEMLPFRLRRHGLLGCELPAKADRQAHMGIHPQRDPDLRYVGIAVPAGRLSADQMAALAELAETHGSGELRLTVWQNLIVPNVAAGAVADVTAALEAMGLGADAEGFASGLVACTGAAGCSKALTHTKSHGLELATELNRRVSLDPPLQIHVNGCRNACARHTCADIGLIGCKVDRGGEIVEGYHVFLGGGLHGAAAVEADDTRLGRRFFASVPASDLADVVAAVVAVFQAEQHADESFRDYMRRQDPADFAARLPLAASIRPTAPHPALNP